MEYTFKTFGFENGAVETVILLLWQIKDFKWTNNLKFYKNGNFLSRLLLLQCYCVCDIIFTIKETKPCSFVIYVNIALNERKQIKI